MRQQTGVGAVQAGSREAIPDHSIFWSPVSHIHSCKMFHDLEVRSKYDAGFWCKEEIFTGQASFSFETLGERMGTSFESQCARLSAKHVLHVSCPRPLWGKVLFPCLCKGGSRGWESRVSRSAVYITSKHMIFPLCPSVPFLREK